MNKDTQKTPHSQEKFKNKYALESTSWYLQLHPAEKKVATFLIAYYGRMTGFKVSRTEIARPCGVSVRTVQYMLNKLRDFGVIEIKSGKVNYTVNTYRITAQYKDPEMILSAKFFFRHLFSLVMIGLLFSQSELPGAHCTPCYKKNVFIKTGSRTVIEKGTFSTGSPDDYTQLRESGGFLDDPPPPTFDKKNPKKGKTMHHPVTQESVDRLKWEAIGTIADKFFLQPRGIVMLRQYPLQALRFAILRIEDCYTKINPFKYLLGILEQFSKENKIAVNRELYTQACVSLGIKEDDALFDEDLLQGIIDERKEKPVSQAVQREKAIDRLKKNSNKANSSSVSSAKRVEYQPEPLRDQSFYEAQLNGAVQLFSQEPEPNIFAKILLQSWSQENTQT